MDARGRHGVGFTIRQENFQSPTDLETKYVVTSILLHMYTTESSDKLKYPLDITLLQKMSLNEHPTNRWRM